MKALILALTLSLAGCASHVPPTLSPAAAVAWQATEAIHALDVLRDVAIDAEQTDPPLLSTASTRAVVQYHRAAIEVIHATPSGWRPTVRAGLDVLVSQLEQHEQSRLSAYVRLIRGLL